MITLDGYKLEYFGLSCEKQTNPMTPNFANKTLSIPGRDGLYNFGSEIKERSLEFNLAAIDKDKNFLQQKLRAFTSFLFDAYGKPREIKLIYNYEPDKYYMVKVSSEIDPDRVMRTGKFNLKFTAYNPYAYSVALADETTWGSEVITFESHYTFGHDGTVGTIHLDTDSEDLKYFVDGLSVKPIIEITGSATGLVLFTGEYQLEFQDFTDSDWVIDCEKYTVLKNGHNAFNEVNLREFILIPGMNRIGSYGDMIDLDIRFKVRDKYI